MSNSVVSFLVPSPHALSLYGTEQLEHSFKHHIQHACGVSLEKSATSLISWLIAAGSSLCVSVNSICLACVQLTMPSALRQMLSLDFTHHWLQMHVAMETLSISTSHQKYVPLSN